MVATTRVYISDALIVKACNEGGSGGVADDLNKTMARVMQRAIALSPMGNAADRKSKWHAMHGTTAGGTYRASFKRKRWGNGKLLYRAIYNDAPHAWVVERGRRSTRFAPGRPGPYEKFSWAAIGGQVIKVPGTGARRGQHVLEDAFKFSTRKYISVGVRRGSFTSTPTWVW